MSECGVLLVNCFPDEREMYVHHLRESGYAPLEACDAADAYETAVRLQPKVVITDMVLPGGGGLDLIRALRANPLTRAMTIIVVSARVFPNDRAAALAAGTDLFLTKPCLPQELANEVERACSVTPPADHHLASPQLGTLLP